MVRSARRGRLGGGTAALDASQFLAVELIGRAHAAAHRLAMCVVATLVAHRWRPSAPSAHPPPAARRGAAAAGASGLAPMPGRRSQEPQRSRRHSRDASCLCPLWQFWIGQYAATACSTRGRPLRASGQKQPSLFRSRGHATFGVTYPTSPVADNMTGAARFQALGAISVQLTNVFRECAAIVVRPAAAAGCRRSPSALLLALPALAAARTIADDRHHPVPLDAQPEHRCDGGQELCARDGAAAVHGLRRRLAARLPACASRCRRSITGWRSRSISATARRASTSPTRSAPTPTGPTACR